jgi:hypothetical protein
MIKECQLDMRRYSLSTRLKGILAIVVGTPVKKPELVIRRIVRAARINAHIGGNERNGGCSFKIGGIKNLNQRRLLISGVRIAAR